MLSAPDVVGPGEVCELLNIGREAFRRNHRPRPDFPPARVLSNGPVWERRAVDAYARQRATGKPYLRVLEEFRRFPGGADSTRCGYVARHLTDTGTKISLPTVRRYLQHLGEIPR
jgi:hypothetical protein